MTGAHVTVRLYADSGEIDPPARRAFEQVVARGDDAHELSSRLEQLVFKAAYHFSSKTILVISAWRDHAGRHTDGCALDFKLDKVRAAALATYLRRLGRVGIGIYTHPRTQYVHLDIRPESYYWLDASPPSVTWKERRILDRTAKARDAAWTPEDDLPL